MELQEQVNALTAEVKLYKEHLESVNAEKLAIDQMLVENLKSSLETKKNIILQAEQVKKLNIEINVLKKEKEVIQKELDDLKSKSLETSVADVAC